MVKKKDEENWVRIVRPNMVEVELKSGKTKVEKLIDTAIGIHDYFEHKDSKLQKGK